MLFDKASSLLGVEGQGQDDEGDVLVDVGYLYSSSFSGIFGAANVSYVKCYLLRPARKVFFLSLFFAWLFPYICHFVHLSLHFFGCSCPVQRPFSTKTRSGQCWARDAILVLSVDSICSLHSSFSGFSILPLCLRTQSLADGHRQRRSFPPSCSTCRPRGAPA